MTNKSGNFSRGLMSRMTSGSKTICEPIVPQLLEPQTETVGQKKANESNPLTPLCTA
jgi:hypothetical protein